MQVLYAEIVNRNVKVSKTYGNTRGRNIILLIGKLNEMNVRNCFKLETNLKYIRKLMNNLRFQDLDYCIIASRPTFVPPRPALLLPKLFCPEIKAN